MPWDRRSDKQQAQAQGRALKTQVVDAIGPFSPYWRDRLKALGTPAATLTTAAALEKLPAVGERDLCPDGDPASAAGLVLQAGESGWALHTDGPKLRRALTSRVMRPGSYRAVVEADTRPTTFVYAGLGLRFPVASTRSDLDVIARAGARLWEVLGLTRADVLVAGLPTGPSSQVQALELAALGAGSPALVVADEVEALGAALRLLPATVLALPTARAADLLDDLDEAEAPLGAVTTLLLVGAPTDAERAQVAAALTRAGVRAKALGVHVPDGHRLMWGECAAGGRGLHTYPDLELVQLVNAESGETGVRGAGEVVLTQLGMRGSALLRWRTADLADGIETAVCSACSRTVPRVTGVQRRALVPDLGLRSGRRGVDLRGVAGALLGRSDVDDWRVVVAPSARGEHTDLIVHVVPKADEDASDVAVAVARDIRAATGVLPSQVVVAEHGELPDGAELTGRVLIG